MKHKTIYHKIIQEGSTTYTITGKTQWKKLVPNIQFQNKCKNTYNSYRQPFQKELHYRLLHYSTKTNHYMHKCSIENNPNCDYCGLTEDNLHLFTHKTNRENLHTPTTHTINVINANKETKKLTLTITQIILYEIWETRNNLKYDNITLPAKTIIHK